MKSRLSYNTAATITAALLLVFGSVLYVWLDVATHSMFYSLYVTGIFAAFFTLPALALLWDLPLRMKLAFLSTFLLFVLVVRNMEWNSRKPFLRELDSVQIGMTKPQVENIMHLYLKNRAPDQRTIAFRHTNDSWGNADIGLVTFENGRVVKVEFLAD